MRGVRAAMLGAAALAGACSSLLGVSGDVVEVPADASPPSADEDAGATADARESPDANADADAADVATADEPDR